MRYPQGLICILSSLRILKSYTVSKKLRVFDSDLRNQKTRRHMNLKRHIHKRLIAYERSITTLQRMSHYIVI